MAYVAPERLTLLPFPQAWTDGVLSLRAVVLPRGTPMDPLITGVPGVEDAPAFADGEIQLEARLIPSLTKLPDPADVTAVRDLGVASPADRRPLFELVESQFVIDPALETATKNPRRAGRQIKKLLTPSYINAFAFAGPRTPFAVLGDEYACAMRRACQLGKPPGPPPSNKTIWGRAISQCLRQPLLAEQMGLLFRANVTPDANFFANGGWLFLALRATSAYAEHATAQPDLIATYAARIPALSVNRTLFAPVLFPVTATPPPGNYDEIFGETAGYDDGFAKIVHATQQTTGMPIGLESNQTAQGPAPSPVRDTGIQLGWDDEQLLVWMNRQIADPATETRQSPMVVRGFRIDVREEGDVDFHSLMKAEADLAVGGEDIGHFTGELNVEVAPLQLENQEDGDYWTPAYFTQWQGRSLVTEDTVDLKLSGYAGTLGQYTPVDDRAVELRYGRTYQFRVRFADLASGGPPPNAVSINPAPAPIATRPFRRFVPPGLPRVEGVPAVPDPLDPPDELTITRPTIGYPTAVFTGAPNAETRLLADAQRIKNEGTGDAPGIPDPDVDTAEISIAVVGLRFDSANDGTGVPPVRTIYTTTRAFPDDPDEPLVVELDWLDVSDVTTVAAPAVGPLPLPRAREVIVTVRAVGRSDPGLDYFGSEAARFGDATSVQMFAAGVDERAFFMPDDPARQLRCVLLRPQEKETQALLARLRASGRGTEADTSPLHLLSEELGLETSGRALWAEPGRRVIFGCSRDLAHVLSPDGSAVTFSSEADLTDRWVVVLTVGFKRDWTWNGDDYVAVEVVREGAGVIGRIRLPRSVNPEVFQAPEIAGAPVDRATTYLVFLDVLDPKPVPPAHPSELSLSYTLTPVFRHPPDHADPPLGLDIDLPIAAPPTQTPRLASAGVALSPYDRADDYSTTGTRTRLLWLEFDAAPENPADAYFGRVLAYAPDPMLTLEAPVSPPPEPPLPISPEFIRVIRPGQSDDRAGLSAMQRLLPTNSPTHFLLPLPPGLEQTSLDLLGFFVYELRLGHGEGWSTARARFGPPLRVTGVQHPAPPLSCEAFRTPAGIIASAPYAAPVYDGRSLLPSVPATNIWVLLYAQVTQADGEDHRNILLSWRPAPLRRKHDRARPVAPRGDARWSQAEIEVALVSLGLPKSSPLSVLAVELLPEVDRAPDPLGSDLGTTRILRSSRLVPVPPVCVQPPCPV
ncbi:MAG TPA: hypothetical protein VN494_05610 [Patescibacteria group bacterium]|nr:hypothetical protein [Patescibacteria group bacterium]